MAPSSWLQKFHLTDFWIESLTGGPNMFHLLSVVMHPQCLPEMHFVNKAMNCWTFDAMMP